MIFMHENNNEVCSESFTFPPNWMKYFENYKYKCLYCKQKAALVRKYDSQPPCRIFSVFNKVCLNLVSLSTFHMMMLLGMSIMAYSNSLDGDFVHDDIAAIVNNNDVMGDSWTNLWQNDFWGVNIRDRRSHKSYRPITTLTFKLTVWAFGLNSRIFHVTNLVLHSICVIMIYITTSSSPNLNLSASTSFISAALFAVHPVHSEAVSGVVGRADLLAAILMLAAFRAGERDPSNLMKVTLYTILAMLCKETGIMSIVIVTAWIFFNRQSCGDVGGSKHSLPLLCKYALVTSALVYLRICLNGTSPIFSPQDNPASFHKSTSTRFLTYSYLWVFNVMSLLCPSTLSYDWQLGSIPLVTSVIDLRIISIILAIIISFCIIKKIIIQHNRSSTIASTHSLLYWCEWLLLIVCHRPVLFSILFMILPFVPASNILQTVGFVAAERTLYMPSIGWCLLLALGCEKLLTLANRTCVKYRYLLYTAILSLLCVHGARLMGRNAVWQSRATLFQSGLASTPSNAKVWYNYGNYLRDQEEKEMAALCYKESVRLWPDYVIALNNLATVTDNQTDIETLLLKALHLDSGHATSLFNLADLYRQQQECSKSKFYFSLCLAYPECLSEASVLINQCHEEVGGHQDSSFQQNLSESDQRLLNKVRQNLLAKSANPKKYAGLERCSANLSHCL